MLRIPQKDPPYAPKELLPTMYDLPSENPQEPGMPDVFHLMQPSLLTETFCPPNYEPDQIFVAIVTSIFTMTSATRPGTSDRTGTPSWACRICMKSATCD